MMDIAFRLISWVACFIQWHCFFPCDWASNIRFLPPDMDLPRVGFQSGTCTGMSSLPLGTAGHAQMTRKLHLRISPSVFDLRMLRRCEAFTNHKATGITRSDIYHPLHLHAFQWHKPYLTIDGNRLGGHSCPWPVNLQYFFGPLSPWTVIRRGWCTDRNRLASSPVKGVFYPRRLHWFPNSLPLSGHELVISLLQTAAIPSLF